MSKTGRIFAFALWAVALLFSLGVGSASAAPLDVALYLLPGGSNGGPPVTPPTGTTNYQLWADDTNAVSGGAFGIADIKILSNGSLSMNTFVPNAANVNGVTSLIGNTLSISNALGITLTAGVFELGTLNVVNAGGAGDITLLSGDYLCCAQSGSGLPVTMTTPQVLAQVPEPGTLLLLGAGIGALGVLIRRARS